MIHGGDVIVSITVLCESYASIEASIVREDKTRCQISFAGHSETDVPILRAMFGLHAVLGFDYGA